MNKSGIYKITCLSNNIIYIGSTNNFTKRKYKHFRCLKRGNHCNPKMQNAYNKYGVDNFIWEEIELIIKLENELNKDFGIRLEKREQHYLDTLLYAQEYIQSNKKDTRFNSFGFNMCPVAGNVQGRLYSEEQKLKQSLATKGRPGKPTSEETKQKQRETKLKNPTRYWLGKNITEEMKQKISEFNSGRKASDETKIKMKISYDKNVANGVKMYKCKSATFISPNGNAIYVENITDFSIKNNLSPSCMLRVINGSRAQHKGYTLKSGY